jgi:hypothetical protein
MTGRSPIELIEEGIRLFRTSGLATLALYYIGSLPFVLALLFFSADMSRDAYAYQRVLPGSFVVALLFLWMNVWQSIYAAELRKRLGGRAGSRWTARRILRVAILQSAVQPTCLIVIPASALIALPLAWVYGFYQNFTVLADGEELRLSELIVQARTYALLWTRQSWLVLLIQSGFALFTAANIAIAIFLLPRLLQMFLGVETVFTKSGANLLSSTFFTICAAMTYLCVDPIMKAIYVLRCFYAESVRSGEDLKAEFRQSVSTVALLLLLLAVPISRATAQPRTGISAPELDRAIDQVIHQRQYAWRLPRQQAPRAESQNFFVRFTQSVLKATRAGIRRVQRSYKQFRDWLNELIRGKRGDRPDGQTGGPAAALQALIYALCAAMAAVLGVLIFRAVRQRKPKEETAPAVAAAAVDLNAENLVADQLPEEGWHSLAKDWIARKDFRMALRALYLASLAYLGERELIRIHRAKSNRDYLRELDRRARSKPELAAVFGQNLAVFESCWYGKYEVGLDAVNAFVANLDRMKASAE